ncbi:ABC transporter permease [Propionivibrio sp.]|uniref:ABC transporter permease n=1 Tax=Propionivibrio sp. TaxID=2212460 RepID=UPI00272E8453|nr:ABC transporter permease [Propionivibrio sp.]
MRTRAILRIARLSAFSRRSTLVLTLAAIALATALLIGVERIRHDTRQSFVQSVSGVDLVVGPRTGAVQLMLYAVFRTGSATHTLRWSSYRALADHPAVAWAVPLSLGDSYRGFPVLGTTPDYFAHFRYGDKRPLALRAGRVFERPFEAVVGSEIAKRLGQTIDSRLVLSHGAGNDLLPEHGDKPFTVVGVLAPTGTPVDRTVHVSLESITALHLDWAGGAPLPGVNIPPELATKFDLTPQEITAVLVGLKQRSDAFRMQRFVNAFRDEALMAVLPGVALDELWDTLDIFERALRGISVLVVLVSLAGLVATLLAGLNERRRELAILRSLGASPLDLFLLLACEGLLITAAGAAAGLLLVTDAAWWLHDALRSAFGVELSTLLPSPDEAWLLAAILSTGLLASAIPAFRAWRMALADGLTPRQ